MDEQFEVPIGSRDCFEHVGNRHGDFNLTADDSDRDFELFGPDDESDLEDGPSLPHHDSRERTSDGVRVQVEDGRVLHAGPSPDAAMETNQSPPRLRSTRRERV